MQNKQTSGSNANIEGFNIIDKQANLNNRDPEVTQSELDQVNKMRDNFATLLKKYNDINMTVNQETANNIDRTRGSNPYFGKNVVFNNNYVCYVTRQGVAKLYPSIDVFENTSGKNGCPTEKIQVDIPWINDYNVKGTLIPTSPPLISGSPMSVGQACGYEGTNVYSTTYDERIDSSYFGCYRNIPETVNTVSLVPQMSGTNMVGDYKATASSMWTNNNNMYGPWRAFDNNPDTFWHSGGSQNNLYDPTSGTYKGTASVTIIDKANNTKSIQGEYITLEIVSGEGISLASYAILPRQDNNLYLNRSPNTWYLLGRLDGKWYEVDFKGNQRFDKNEKSFFVSNKNVYDAFMLLITKVGNNDANSNRFCVQIADLKLMVNEGNQSPAMTSGGFNVGYTSLETCKKYAYENDYRYYGMQDYNENTGYASCVVSNDLTKSIQYGDASKIVKKLPIWSTNTSGTPANQLYLSADGQLKLVDSNDGTVYWSSSNGPVECKNSGGLDMQNITATYGGNCNGRGWSIQPGNVTDAVKAQLLDKNINPELPNENGTKSIYKIYSSNYTFGDPAVGCPKSFDISYSCGNKPMAKNIPYGEWQTILLDCSGIAGVCNFQLAVNDDGNLLLFQDNPNEKKRNNQLWSSQTSGQSKTSNQKWTASKCKFGKNYMTSGQSLNSGEWIGSINGSTFLKLENDGNLVLYTNIQTEGCVKKQDANYGTADINAIYQINNPQDNSSIAKFAYIDEDTNLREYSGEVVTNSGKFILFEDYNSAGNNIQELNNVSMKDVMDACNKNADCGGFLYDSKQNKGWIKNKNIFPNSAKQYMPGIGLVLGIKKLEVSKDTSCNKNTTDITTSMLKRFPKGKPISQKNQCYSNFLSQKTMLDFDKVKSELRILGKELATQMETLYNKDKKIHEKFGMNEAQFKKNLDLYKNIDKVVRDNLTALEINDYYYNIEGMQNLTSDDINGMLTDTELRALQENYSYFLWTILAVGTVAATIQIMKR